MDAEYRTNDLEIASYLYALGYRPLRIEGPENRRVAVFPMDAFSEIASYHDGVGNVMPAKRLFKAYREMKHAFLPMRRHSERVPVPCHLARK